MHVFARGATAATTAIAAAGTLALLFTDYRCYDYAYYHRRAKCDKNNFADNCSHIILLSGINLKLSICFYFLIYSNKLRRQP